MSRLRADQYPPHVQAQIARAIYPTSTAPSAKMIRQAAGDGMNKTERAFRDWLVASFPRAEIHREVSLPLANGARYKPDFLTAQRLDSSSSLYVAAWEVKGFMRDDAAVKIKVAAKTYPWIHFTLAWRKNDAWKMQEVRP
jgi:hypothetical protein